MADDPKITYKFAVSPVTNNTISTATPEQLAELARQQQTEKNKQDAQKITKIYQKKQSNIIDISDTISDISNNQTNQDTIVDNVDNIAKLENKPEKRKLGTYGFQKGKSGNPAGRPKTKDKRTISSLIDKKLSNKKDAQEFVDRLFEIFHKSDKNPMSAGTEILNRHEGKIKDIVQVERVGEHVPDQQEMLEIQSRFRRAK